MIQSWEEAEKAFDRHWISLGKRAHLWVFKDARSLHGMNKRRTAVGNQPSDRLVTFDGETFFAEVKFTTDPKAFGFNLIKPSQHGFAKQEIAAGGRYFIFVYSSAVGRWFKIPYQVIDSWPRRSMTWDQLTEFECLM